MPSIPLKQRLRQIPVEKEEEVLEEFLFELTIAFRAVRSIEGLQGDDLIKALRMINEINHRVLNRIRALRTDRQSSFPDYVAEMVTHHVHQAPVIAGWVGAALDRALKRYDT